MANSDFTPPKLCVNCATDISMRGNRSERCVLCAEVHAKDIARTSARNNQRRRRAIPEYRTRQNAQARVRSRERYRTDPAYRKKKQERALLEIAKRQASPELAILYNAKARLRWASDAAYKARKTRVHLTARQRNKETPERVVAQRKYWREWRRRRYATDANFRAAIIERVALGKWDSTVTRSSVAALLSFQGGKCALCGVEIQGGDFTRTIYGRGRRAGHPH